MTRTITPHKGGRIIKKSLDVTPETADLLAKLPMSLGDLVEWAAQAKQKETLMNIQNAIEALETGRTAYELSISNNLWRSHNMPTPLYALAAGTPEVAQLSDFTGKKLPAGGWWGMIAIPKMAETYGRVVIRACMGTDTVDEAVDVLKQTISNNGVIPQSVIEQYDFITKGAL